MSFGMFVFGETLKKAIEFIPEDNQLRYYRYITDYGLNGIEPDLSGFEAATWVQMKTLIDNTMPTKGNYRTGKNGAPFGNSNASKQPKQPVPEKQPENNSPNGNGNENVNVNVNEKENDNVPQSGEDCFSFSGSESQEDTPEPDPLPDKPSKSKEDATTVFNKARTLWNGLGLTQCRDLIMPGTRRDECLRTLQNYSWLEIENAINNFQFHVEGKFKSGEKWARPPPYGSLYGFLETGVARYFDDKAFEQQFREV